MSNVGDYSKGFDPVSIAERSADTAFDIAYTNFAEAPLEFTDWREEQLSWKTSCYIHAGISRGPQYRWSGPDVVPMFNDICVNNLGRLQVGSSTHLVTCSPNGNITGSGMLLREREDSYISIIHKMHVLRPWESGQYDVKCENLTGRRFFFQVAGPRSLEVLEAAMLEDLHDIRFLRHRDASGGSRRLKVTQSDLHVLRLGMAGTLAYEVHGDIEDAERVYDAILEAGEPFGIRQLGSLVYIGSHHTENGFPNTYIHFPPAFVEYPEMMEYLERTGDPRPWPVLRGSMGLDVTKRFVTPYDLGWGHIVKFDHEFIGREALEAVAGAPPRTMVTLLWNVDDVLDTFRSQLEPGEAHQLMTLPGDEILKGRRFTLFNDQVLKDGRLVGVSMGRMYSAFYHDMISLAPIDVEHSEIGTEVTVLWGDPGTRQKEIRATVARYPYLDLDRNEHVDTSAIPSLESARS